MRIKVELHREVTRFLRHEATDQEREAFSAQLARIRASSVALIENSEPTRDPNVSRYVLRFFRFSNVIAVFETNRDRNLIRVRRCQRVPRRQAGNREPKVGS